MDQVFAVRQVCKKYLANRKDVLWSFMYLEKTYGTIDRHGPFPDAKSVWSWSKLVESGAEFLC